MKLYEAKVAFVFISLICLCTLQKQKQQQSTVVGSTASAAAVRAAEVAAAEVKPLNWRQRGKLEHLRQASVRFDWPLDACFVAHYCDKGAKGRREEGRNELGLNHHVCHHACAAQCQVGSQDELDSQLEPARRVS